jgi:hypothetical protein
MVLLSTIYLRFFLTLDNFESNSVQCVLIKTVDNGGREIQYII